MHFRKPVLAVCMLLLLDTSLLLAADLRGTVVSSQGTTVQFVIDGDMLPSIGDPCEIHVAIPGAGTALVGSAVVTKVVDGTVFAKLSKSTASIAKGQSVQIQSSSPVPRTGSKVPLLIGRSAADARTTLEAAGFKIKLEIGVIAPTGVEPFSVYSQNPAAGDQTRPGTQVVVTLYGKSDSDPSQPKLAPPMRQSNRDPTHDQSASSIETSPPVAVNLKGPDQQTKQIVMTVARTLPQQHLSAHPLDDEIGRRTFDNFVNFMDPRKLYFLQADIDEFKRDRFELHNKLQQGDIDFAYRIFNRLLMRTAQRIGEVREHLAANHDFTVNEEISTDFETILPAADEAELRERWRQQIKYDLLTESINGTAIDDAQYKILHRYTGVLDRLKQFTDDQLLRVTLTVLAHAYDPQGTYVSPESWRDYVIQNEREMVGIGASLSILEGHVAVDKIITGSPSHQDGRLKAGDRVLAVGQGKDGELVDLAGKPLFDVVNLIRGEAGTVARLQVVPKGKFEATIYPITRQKFDIQKTQATVLTGADLPNGRSGKLGFIFLDAFYRDWKPKGDSQQIASSSVRDVQEILSRFRSQEVDIVVIDLRTASGGVLSECIDTVGLFIDQGNVVQVQGRDGRIERYDDQKPGMDWDKPLVVLTSSLTSSGSEILAGALQNYGRALIVGDEHTHGSGIVGYMVDLGEALFGKQNPPNLGRLKVNSQRFYLPSGESTQMKGVASDVVLPSLTSVTASREESLPHALGFDKIAPVALQKAAYGIDDKTISSLRSQSLDRRTSSSYFDELDKTINAYRDRVRRKAISLNREAYLQQQRSAEPSDSDAPSLNGIPDVKADGYLTEALNVALDYLALTRYAEAQAAYASGQYSDGVAKYKQAVSIDPQFRQGHYQLAWALATGRARDGQLAVVHAKRAVELSPSENWVYRLALAVAYAEAQDFDSAQQNLELALQGAGDRSGKYEYLRQRFQNRQAYGN